MRKLRWILLLLALCAALTLPALAADAAPPATPTEGDVWDGTILEPTKLVKVGELYYYEITKCSELAYVAQTGGDWVTYNYILGNDLILNDLEITLDENGEAVCSKALSECVYWQSIGNSSAAFTGIFDGAGHTINGLYCGVGLFGTARKATVKNLTVTNGYVAGVKTDEITPAAKPTGGIVGLADCSSVQNCVFSGIVLNNAKTITGTDTGIGGIVGAMRIASITDCINYGSVTTELWSTGGIVGRVHESGTITGCINYGQIQGSGTGGICGNTYDTMDYKKLTQDCSNYGKIHSISNYTGGIIGNSSSQVVGCVNYGSVELENQKNGAAGGICGMGKASDCRNYGNVTGGTQTGGITGTGVVSGCYNYANVYGYGHAGGICGSAKRGSFSIAAKSCNYGSITSEGDYVGGIAGGVEYTPSSATATTHYSIKDCYNVGNVAGNDYVGGLTSVEKNIEITNSYTIGSVTAKGTAFGAVAPASNYIWSSNFPVEHVYYLIIDGCTAFGTGDDAEGVVEGKTAEELRVQATFEGWDFDKVWAIDPEKNSGYPYLQGQELEEVPVTGVSLNKTALTLGAGDQEYLVAAVSPATAQNTACTWRSSAPAVASVSAQGRVEALTAGQAVITVTTAEGGFTASCTVTVTERSQTEYRINGITLTDAAGADLDAIPQGNFWATVSLTHMADEGDAMVILASYDASGRYLGMLCARAEDLPVGSTIRLSLRMDNSKGEIARIRAFLAPSFANLSPIGTAVEF